MGVHLTVDEAPDGWSWNGEVGVVPKILTDLKIPPDNAVAVVCGPPIMIRYAHIALRELGFSDEQIYTTLEMKMKCGVVPGPAVPFCDAAGFVQPGHRSS